jgi:hypothetical protein
MSNACAQFINNCVGRGNLRAFLQFLVWVVAAQGVMLTLTANYLWQQRAVVRSLTPSFQPFQGSV